MKPPSRPRQPSRPPQTGESSPDTEAPEVQAKRTPAHNGHNSHNGHGVSAGTGRRPCARLSDPPEPSSALPLDAERMLAATLALMTRFYRTPHAAICRQLLDNLSLLGRHPGLSASLRTACLNSQVRWLSYLEEVECTLAELAAQRDANGLLSPPGGEGESAPARTLH